MFEIHKSPKKPAYRPELEQVQLALDQYVAAQSYFNQALGVDQVEHAVYLLEAARRGYCFALKRLREADAQASGQ